MPHWLHIAQMILALLLIAAGAVVFIFGSYFCWKSRDGLLTDAYSRGWIAAVNFVESFWKFLAISAALLGAGWLLLWLSF